MPMSPPQVSPPGPAEVELLRSVEVVADAALARELIGRLRLAGPFPTLSVSDLLAQRRAFWRRSGPAAPVVPAREERMEAGRRWHRRVLELLPGEGTFEVRFRRDGVAGRIDLLADVPVEIKTSVGPSPEPPSPARAEEIEQLAMYCALTTRPAGRLVRLLPKVEGGLRVTAWDIAFPDLAALRIELGHRAAALRASLAPGGDPSELPRCPWYGRGCEFRSASLCDCTGGEAPAGRGLLDSIGPVRERPDIEERWSAVLSVPDATVAGPEVSRFRDLLYPRRAYFDRAGPELEAADRPPTPVEGGPRLYDRILAAVEGGPIGEVALLRSFLDGPDEEVVGFRGRPYLVRTSKAWAPLRPVEAIARMPQYALELGFRAAVSGTDRGLALVAYERAEADEDRVQALEYRFPRVERFAEFWRERSAALLSAIRDGAPRSLPACPGWMYEGCPYRGICGCAAEPPRSQR